VIGSGVRAEATKLLRRCQMPPDEIRWVLTAEDPAVVHMILELHRERLEEELVERRKALGELEMRLTEWAGEALSRFPHRVTGKVALGESGAVGTE
jgi:hypothetical protein